MKKIYNSSIRKSFKYFGIKLRRRLGFIFRVDVLGNDILKRETVRGYGNKWKVFNFHVRVLEPTSNTDIDH